MEGEGVENSRPLYRHVCYALILIYPLIQLLRLVAEKNFSIDEFTYAHAGWLVAEGYLPFRDFFSHHFPLSYFVFSILFLAFGADPTAIIYARLLMLPFLVTIIVSVWLINRGIPPVWRMVSVLMVISSPNFAFFATELRPDTLALAAFLLAAALCSLECRSRFGIGFLTGLLLVLTVWFSEKALTYSIFLGLALIYEGIQGRKRLSFGKSFRGVGGGRVCDPDHSSLPDSNRLPDSVGPVFPCLFIATSRHQ